MKLTVKNIILVPLLAVFFTVSCIIPAAEAAVIETETILNLETAPGNDTVQLFFAREDVKRQMIQLGVDPADVQKRLASLSDAELQQLQNQIHELPAGAGALAVLGAVFLVLLILELVGVTNIFTRL